MRPCTTLLFCIFPGIGVTSKVTFSVKKPSTLKQNLEIKTKDIEKIKIAAGKKLSFHAISVGILLTAE